jgi:hypothetical protein
MRRLSRLSEDAADADLGEAMGKKQFQRIADIIRPRAGKADVKEIAREMAAFFASENPQFDTARFLKAAGLHGASAGAISASADEDLDEAARPPKPWMDSCLARQKGNRKIRDAGAVCSEIWRGMGPEGQRRAKRAGTFEDAEVTEAPRRTLVPWADDPELGGLSV